MKLKTVRVRDFRSVRDSGEFSVCDVTCLVGKNESGKTAILEALYKLNPIRAKDAGFDVTYDYPKSDVTEYELRVSKDREAKTDVVEAVFELSTSDLAEINDWFGAQQVCGARLTLRRSYENPLRWEFETSEEVATKGLRSKFEVPQPLKPNIEAANSLAELKQALPETQQANGVQELSDALHRIEDAGGLRKFLWETYISPRVPKFLYFDDYYLMTGAASIDALLQRKDSSSLLPSDAPLLGLVSLARLSLKELRDPSRTQELKNKLEGAGNHLTKTVVKYWSQNRHLRMVFDVRVGHREDPAEMQQGMNLSASVYDTRHWVTTEMRSRSRGFRWFFSFLAWYHDLKQQQEGDIILLLDEPGLTLHAKAQMDLLRYFDREIAADEVQLVYTTHSPFMVPPDHFERVRIVQDRSLDEDDLPEGEDGAKVITEVLEASKDSLFPLQGALGYDISQTLFVGPNSLVVEGSSDLLYLQAMSAILERKGRHGLDQRWTITPVGGADKVPTFVALLGAQTAMNVTVLIDIQAKDRQSIENLYKKKLLEKSHVVTYGDFTGKSEADVEDMFNPEFYLRLVNDEFKESLPEPIVVSKLPTGPPRILRRIDAALESRPMTGGAQFNHYRPARYLTEQVGSLDNDIDDPTLDRFEQAFMKLNALLP